MQEIEHASTVACNGRVFAEQIEQLEQGITGDSIVLVKGSRSMGMEQIVNALLDEHNVQEVD